MLCMEQSQKTVTEGLNCGRHDYFLPFLTPPCIDISCHVTCFGQLDINMHNRVKGLKYSCMNRLSVLFYWFSSRYYNINTPEVDLSWTCREKPSPTDVQPEEKLHNCIQPKCANLELHSEQWKRNRCLLMCVPELWSEFYVTICDDTVLIQL